MAFSEAERDRIASEALDRSTRKWWSQQFRGLSEDQRRISAELYEVRKMSKASYDRTEEANDRMDQIETALGEIIQRLDGIDERLSNAGKTFVEMKKRVAKLEG